MRSYRILLVINIWILVASLVAIPAHSKKIPEQVLIKGVKGQAQTHTLSCESRSAVDWAAFWGVNLREKKFLDSLPRADNPDEGFVGEISGYWGAIPPSAYGVHAEPVAILLRKHGLDAEARRNMNWDQLRLEIASGRPVIVWVIGQMWKGTPLLYEAPSGKRTIVAHHEHTMIIIGYDPKTVTAVDAFSGKTKKFFKRNFLQSWKVLGNMAITGGKKSEKPAGTPVWQIFLPVLLDGSH